MAAQSRPPILITRPEPQASRWARWLRRQEWTGSVHVSPLMRLELLPFVPPPDPFSALVLTSESAALAARGVAGLPRLAWCVGPRTAAAARAAGFRARSADGDARELVAAIRGDGEEGPLLYLHGHDIAKDLVTELAGAGIPTTGVEVYRQTEQGLSAAAQRLIRREGPIVLPILSPRSATLLARAWANAEARATPHVVAISPAVATAAAALQPAHLSVATMPNGESLLQTLRQHMVAGREP